MSGEPKNDLPKWIELGLNYPKYPLNEKVKNLSLKFSGATGASPEGLNGYLSRIDKNLNINDTLHNKKKFTNIVEIGPGWGALRLFAETLNVETYSAVEPIKETKEILQLTNSVLQKFSSNIDFSVTAEIESIVDKKNGVTLFYASNVLSEINNKDMVNYLEHIANRLKKEDCFIIEDWHRDLYTRRDDGKKLVSIIFSEFDCIGTYFNFWNYHISTSLTKKSSSSVRHRYNRLKVFFHFYVSFNVLKATRKIKKDGLRGFFKALINAIRNPTV